MAANTRIIFFGTPEFAVHCLEALVAAKQNIVAVVTAPDRKAGRGKKWRSSAVCLAAKAHGLAVLQPENLKASEFIAALRAYNPTLMVVVAFRMLPKQVWSIPKKGCFNLHASLPLF
jgi:methionyl-tRNA formyltransferase